MFDTNETLQRQIALGEDSTIELKNPRFRGNRIAVEVFVLLFGQASHDETTGGAELVPKRRDIGLSHCSYLPSKSRLK